MAKPQGSVVEFADGFSPDFLKEWGTLAKTKEKVIPDNLRDIFILPALTILGKHLGWRSLCSAADLILWELNGERPCRRTGEHVDNLVVATSSRFNPQQIWNAVEQLNGTEIRLTRPPDDSLEGHTIRYDEYELASFVVLPEVSTKNDNKGGGAPAGINRLTWKDGTPDFGAPNADRKTTAEAAGKKAGFTRPPIKFKFSAVWPNSDNLADSKNAVVARLVKLGVSRRSAYRILENCGTDSGAVERQKTLQALQKAELLG